LLAAGRSLEGRFAGHHDKSVTAAQQSSEGEADDARGSIIPQKPLDRFLEVISQWRKDHDRRPVIFHSYDWGGYLTWHGWPTVLHWIDDRNEVQRRDRVQQHFAIQDARPGWQEKIRKVDLICIESGAPLTARLEAARDTWGVVYRHREAVIFE